MGLKVDGFGATTPQLAEALKPREADLEAVLNLPLDRIEIPKKKAAQQKLAAELDRQIEILRGFENSADPKVRADAKHMLTVARAARLDLEGRILSWAVQGLEDRPNELTSTEAGAIFALFGPTFSNGEINHAVSVLEAHLTPDIRREHVHALADATAAKADQVGRRMSAKSRKVFLARTVPILGGLAASRAIGILANLEPAVGLAVNLAAIQTGLQLSLRTGGQAVATEGYAFGQNRLEGQEVDHDLVMLHQRASRLQQRLYKKSDTDGQLIVDKDIALIRMVCAKRRETWDARGADVPAAEKNAVAKFESIADLLEDSGIENVRGGIKNLGINKRELAKLPTLPQLLPQPFDSADTAEAFGTVLCETAKQCLNVGNMQLKRLITLLESKHLADGSALTEAESKALQRFAGDSPNVAEVLALGRLAGAGVVDLNALWPDAKIRDHNGNVLKKDDAKLIFETLGTRARGANVEKLGRVIGLVAPFLAAGAAWLAATMIGEPSFASMTGVMSMLGAIGASIATHMGGFFLAKHVESKGTQIKLTQGLEVQSALGNEYAIVLPKLLDPDSFLAGGVDDAKKALADEAEVLDVVIASVGAAVQSINEALGQLMLGGALDTPEQKQAFESLQNMLVSFQRSKQTHYDVLSAVKGELQRISTEAETEADVRDGFADIRNSLYGLMPVTWGDVVLSGSYDELSPGLTLYYGYKLQILEGLKGWDGNGDVPDGVKQAAEAMNEVAKLLPKGHRPSKKDAVDNVAKNIGRPDKVRGQLSAIRDPRLENTIRERRIEDLSIDDKRAKGIAQEVVNALFSQLYPVYGLAADDADPPKAKGLKVTTIPADDPHSFPKFRVEGSFDGGGKLGVTLSAAGRISENIGDLELDLGTTHLGRMAARAVSAHAEARTGQETPIGNARLVSQHDDGKRTFAVSSGNSTYEVTIGPKGELDNESIREK